jgi:hypothetical protein
VEDVHEYRDPADTFGEGLRPHREDLSPCREVRSPHRQGLHEGRAVLSPCRAVLSRFLAVLSSRRDVISQRCSVVGPYREVRSSKSDDLREHQAVLSLHREALSPHGVDLSSDRGDLFAPRDILSSPPGGPYPASPCSLRETRTRAHSYPSAWNHGALSTFASPRGPLRNLPRPLTSRGCDDRATERRHRRSYPGGENGCFGTRG